MDIAKGIRLLYSLEYRYIHTAERSMCM